MTPTRPQNLAWTNVLRAAIRRAFPEATRPEWQPHVAMGEHPAGWRLVAQLPGLPGVQVAFIFLDTVYVATLLLNSGKPDYALYGFNEWTELPPNTNSLQEMLAWLSVARDAWLRKYQGVDLTLMQVETPFNLGRGPAKPGYTIRTGSFILVHMHGSGRDNAVWEFEFKPVQESRKLEPLRWGAVDIVGLQTLARGSRLIQKAREQA